MQVVKEAHKVSRNLGFIAVLQGPFLRHLAAIEERRLDLSSIPALPEKKAVRVP